MNQSTKNKFGTAPVFFTAISTILGAILFLRFGFAVGKLGFWGVLVIIMLGHMVTIPTAFAISEISTNQRVKGGGEYYIISRSFGLNIGATIRKERDLKPYSEAHSSRSTETFRSICKRPSA